VNVASQSQTSQSEVQVKPLSKKDSISFDILSEFGLTENQTKVFIATARLGTPTVAEVADASEVRREEVYRLLPELEGMGLVERLLGKPLRLRTPDPKSALATLVKIEKQRSKERIEELSSKSQELLQSLGHQVLEPPVIDGAESDFSLIQEKEAIRTGLYDMISKSTQQLDLLFARTDLIWLLSTQGEALQAAIERGVKIRIMSEPPSGRDRLPKILQRRFPADVEVPMKYLLSPTTFYLISDKSQIMLITSGIRHLPSSTCLWTNNESMVVMAYSNFEERWHESVHWKTVDGIALSVSPQDGEEGGTSHVHRLLLYQSSEVKYKVLFNFLKQRSEAGHMIIYVCSENNVKDVKDALSKLGFESKLKNKKEALRIITWESFLLDDGTFSLDKAKDVWDDFYFEAQDDGYKGLAAASEMQFFFDSNSLRELEEYEKHIHDMLESQIEIKCAYDEKSILHTKSPLQLYARLLGYHTTLLSEEKEGFKRIKTRS
jgi:sugar-specific transcriptional regulator TrmB